MPMSFQSQAPSGGAATASGMDVIVAAFATGPFSFPGGTITLASLGTWYVGVDLFSGALIALPRLGHRGWVPVAKVVAGAGASSVEQIAPVLPKSRLPRFTKKVRDGQATNILVLGSSLAEGTGTTYWSGMLFSAGSSVAAYKVPGAMVFNNFALGGTPNQYQLAQLGLGSAYQAVDYAESGFPRTIAGKTPPNGRSSMFTGVDLVVITMLANGGDYRLQCIEPIIRQLRKLDIEVVVTTDNPHGATQVGGTGPYTWPGGYAAITTAGLYVDGPEVMRIADLYNCEIADTAAYVVDASLRYPAADIYRDGIHMHAAAPNGRTGQPSGGYEVYARAIRSCIPVDANIAGISSLGTGFDVEGQTDGWVLYAGGVGGSLVSTGGRLVATNGTGGSQFGALIYLPRIKLGDTVRVQGEMASSLSVQIGLQGGGSAWGSGVAGAAAGTFDVTLTAARDIVDGTCRVLVYGGTTDGASFSIEEISITVNSSYEGAANEIFPRDYEAQTVPSSRIVTDTKTPGGAFVILPKDEEHLRRVDAYRGALGAHPLGAASFARRFSSAVGASEDLLTLVPGNRAALSALGVVGHSLIYYSLSGDPAVTFEVYGNNNLLKSITIPAQTISREIYLPIYTPTQLNKADVFPSNHTIDLRVTAGTLRIAALIALTFDLDLLPPEAASRIGTWTAKVPGGSPAMPGYGTDTAGDYAVVQCPPASRRVAWIISNKPNSKATDTWSGRTLLTDTNAGGVNHIRVRGNHVGPGEFHYIRLNASQPNADQPTNGYGLHFGGLVLVNDR